VRRAACTVKRDRSMAWTCMVWEPWGQMGEGSAGTR
jgi:hypothetical protein